MKNKAEKGKELEKEKQAKQKKTSSKQQAIFPTMTIQQYLIHLNNQASVKRKHAGAQSRWTTYRQTVCQNKCTVLATTCWPEIIPPQN